MKTVPQTDTGGQDEDSKALERTQEKELGKLAPYFGRRCAPVVCSGLPVKHDGVAVNWWLRLFNKNTALCKHESGRIGCDACPVPEG